MRHATLVQGLISAVAAGMLPGGSILTPYRPPPAAAQGPTERCSARGASVVRVRLLDPAGRRLTVPANAVIVSLHCGAAVDPQGIAELVAVPPGPHVVRVAALGCTPDSVTVSPGTADTVLTEVRLRTCLHVRHAE